MKLAATSAKRFIKPAAGIVTAAVAITTTVNVAASKFQQNQPFIGNLGVTVSRILGPGITKQLFAGITNNASNNWNLPPAGIVLTGPINTTTFGGAGILVADHVIRMFKVPYYAWASPFIKALGIGLLTGGVVGGLLDPDPAQVSNLAPVNYPTIAPTSPPVQMGMTQTASGALQF